MPPETFSRSRALAPAPDGGPARGGGAVRNPKLKPKALRKRKAEGGRRRLSPAGLPRGRLGRDSACPPSCGCRPPPSRAARAMGPPSPATSCWPCAPSSGGGRPPSAPPGDGWDEGAATAFAFVLLPMLRAALLSTVPSAPSVSFSASADETNRLLEAGAATGSAEELSRLRRAGNVRVLRLHGTRAEGGEEDLAAMESPDYCRAVRDAFALGRRMEARRAARREVRTQVQQQAQKEGAIDRLERWYIFHIAAWART